MPLLLVRHAASRSRAKWSGDDHLRPLSPKGQRQAADLVDLFACYDIARIISSPYLRCLQTVEPLAAARGLNLETAEELAEGHDVAGLTLLTASDRRRAVLCGHGDTVPFMLMRLGVDITNDSFKCEKGSTWVMAEDGTSSYLPPPGKR